MGPCLVSAARRVREAREVELRTVVNGAVVQEARADDMIFSVAEIVAYLSQVSWVVLSFSAVRKVSCGE